MKVETRLRALRDAARDVCPVCGFRSLPHVPLEGPNEAGNFHHAGRLCKASSIYSRIVSEFGWLQVEN